MTRADLRQRRHALAGAWESFVRERRTRGVRDEVAASWTRSAAVLSPTVEVAPVDGDDVVRSAWDTSPLRPAFAAIEAELRRTALDLDYVGAVTDASGRILWSVGGATMQRRAESVGFVPGGHWDEESVGTNALDLALRAGAPATVYSAEHFSPAVHGWVCYAAPVTHPVTGDVLGVVDLSSTWDRAHPLALTSVTAMARAMAAELGRALATAGVPRPRAGDERTRRTDAVPPDAVLHLEVLGDGSASCGGVRLLLPRRQLEILALLALDPGGHTLEQLHGRLYGDVGVARATLKAELSHLRRAIGGGIASRPYRLERDVDCDVITLLDQVRRGDVRAAAELYTGALLPWSESPVITDWRHHVDVAVRSAVATARDADAAMALAEHFRHDEDAVHDAWVLLPAGDPRRSLVAGWLAALES